MQAKQASAFGYGINPFGGVYKGVREVSRSTYRPAQANRKIGIDEIVRHSDKPTDVASEDPELRVWDALDAGTHDGTLQDAILEHMQACSPHLPILLSPLLSVKMRSVPSARHRALQPAERENFLMHEALARGASGMSTHTGGTHKAGKEKFGSARLQVANYFRRCNAGLHNFRR